MERYKKEMEAYKPSQAFLLKKAALKKKSGGQKLTGELDKYFEFLSYHWRNISSAHPGLSAVHVQALVWQKWSKEVQGVVGNMGKGTVGNRLHVGKRVVGNKLNLEKGKNLFSMQNRMSEEGMVDSPWMVKEDEGTIVSLKVDRRMKVVGKAKMVREM